MTSMVDKDAVCWRLVERIKSAIDPNDIIARGRYTISR
jgi:hypothetical protein